MRWNHYTPTSTVEWHQPATPDLTCMLSHREMGGGGVTPLVFPRIISQTIVQTENNIWRTSVKISPTQTLHGPICFLLEWQKGPFICLKNICEHFPANTGHSPDAVSMLGQRRRRWDVTLWCLTFERVVLALVVAADRYHHSPYWQPFKLCILHPFKTGIRGLNSQCIKKLYAQH